MNKDEKKMQIVVTVALWRAIRMIAARKDSSITCEVNKALWAHIARDAADEAKVPDV